MNQQTQANPFPELEALKAKAQQTQDKVERLQLMKQWVDKAGRLAAQDEGRIKQLEDQRAREYGCPTDELALEMIQELEGDVAELDKEINDGTKVLMKEMGWT